MKYDKESLKDFERTANKMLDSLQEFLPNIEALKTLAISEIDEDSKKLVDEFSEKAKDLNVIELTKLKEEYLQKLKDGI